jgi:hypothetical protein
MFKKQQTANRLSSMSVERGRGNLIGDSQKRTDQDSWPGRVVREIAHRLRIAIFTPTLERAREIECEKLQAERHRLAEEYSQGYLTGWHECYDACLNAIEDELAEKCEIWASGALLTGPDNLTKAN